MTAGGNASLVAGLANQQILPVSFVLNWIVCCKISRLLLFYSTLLAVNAAQLWSDLANSGVEVNWAQTQL